MKNTEDNMTLENILKKSKPKLKCKLINKKTDKFIKGPIPLDWMIKTATISPTAVEIGLILYFLSGINKSKTVKLTNWYINKFNIHRDSKYKILSKMEKAGLISIIYKSGKSPMITIEDCKNQEKAR